MSGEYGRPARQPVGARDELDGALDAALARFDVTDPAFLADPYPVLAALREATPVFRHRGGGHHPKWFVTRFADVHALLRHPALARVTDGDMGRGSRWAHFWAAERWSLLELEPPDHARLRSLVANVFTARSVAALRPTVEALAAEVVGAGAERARVDLRADVAQPYSIAVICALLGVPRSDGPQLLAWSHAMVKMYELAATEAQMAAADAAARDFARYVRALVAERRRRPVPGLLSDLVHVAGEAGRLTEDEIVSTTILLLNAGHEATVNTLGNGMWAFLRHPDQWRRVTIGEVAAKTAIEEMIRFDGPLQLFERWVLEDGVVVGDKEVPVGEKVALLFGSANHDPRRFPAPDRFDAGRGDSTHIGFGGGIHYCLGAPLARLELEVALGTLAARAPTMALVAEPRRQPAFVIRGLEALMVDLAG